MTRLTNASRIITRSPLLWGGLAAAGFYALIRAGVLRGEIIESYFTSHPVEYLATVMFFVGLASLVVKLTDVLAQQAVVDRAVLPPTAPSGHAARDCDVMLDQLDRLPGRRRHGYLVGRLRAALEHVRRRGSADSLDDELKYLSELDGSRAAAGFALVRVIIWAIPILGFLGTVIGITLAIANLAQDGGMADGAIEDAIPKVVAGLSVAFATTAQALVLSIVLMFAQYFTDRKESALLAEVDHRAAAELEGRFLVIPKGPEGAVAALERIAQTLSLSAEQLVQRQATVWQASIEEASARWATMADSAGKQLRAALGEALAASLKEHARELAAAEQAASTEARRHWDKAQQAQVQQTHAMASLQASVTRGAEVLARAVEATGEVARLEEALNRNLAALAGAKHFEQTVISLAAAIQLLSARLAEGPPAAGVKLEVPKRGVQAA